MQESPEEMIWDLEERDRGGEIMSVLIFLI